MVTITGRAWFQSGNTDIMTVVVETYDGFDIKYRILAIPNSESTTENDDAIRAADWGNKLPVAVGYVIVKEAGYPCEIEVPGRA